MHAIRLLVGLSIGVSLLAPHVLSAEVTMKRAENRRVASLMLEGEIVPGDAEKILAFTREAAAEGLVVVAIQLRSPGGDVLEAIKISGILNKNLITATAPWKPSVIKRADGNTKTVPSTCMSDGRTDPRNCICYSSCAIVWLTSALRSGDSVGVHRPRFQESYFAGLNTEEAQEKYAALSKELSSFLVENEVPLEIVTKMMAVPSGKIHVLTGEETALAGEGKAYILELLHAKCSPYHFEYGVTQQLAKRFEDLSRDFETMADAGNDFSIEIGEKMLAAQNEYYDYERNSQYPKCIREKELELQTNAQKIK